jgi:hypothetical protein
MENFHTAIPGENPTFATVIPVKIAAGGRADGLDGVRK